MKIKETISSKMSVLDAAICFGLAAIFLAVAVPLIRGAALRKQTAECARKVMWAADAFDLYATASGEYPPDGERAGAVRPCHEMNKTFYDLDIDWWGETPEVGGAWDWFRDDHRGFIAIINPRVSERCMRQLDRLLDDGNLDAGVFRRYGSVYCYILEKQRQTYASL